MRVRKSEWRVQSNISSPPLYEPLQRGFVCTEEPRLKMEPGQLSGVVRASRNAITFVM